MLPASSPEYCSTCMLWGLLKQYFAKVNGGSMKACSMLPPLDTLLLLQKGGRKEITH